MKKQQLEKAIENQIFEYLEMRGHFPIKHENVATYDPKLGGHRKFNSKTKRKGVSDILCVMQDGSFAAFEVKTPEEYVRIERNLEKWLMKRSEGYKHSDGIRRFLEQWDFICEVRKRGGIAHFVSGSGDLIRHGI
jgi:hypothetical protein